MYIPSAAARALAKLVNDREQEIHEALSFFADELKERGVEYQDFVTLRDTIRDLVNLAEFPEYDDEVEALLDPDEDDEEAL